MTFLSSIPISSWIFEQKKEKSFTIKVSPYLSFSGKKTRSSAYLPISVCEANVRADRVKYESVFEHQTCPEKRLEMRVPKANTKNGCFDENGKPQ